MSEEILNAIIQLLALVAAEDEVTTDERATIENFLRENLNEEATRQYIYLFDKLSRSQCKSRTEEDTIRNICRQINSEQTSQQKIIIILNLINLIAADGIVSDRENELLYLIGDNLNISKEIIDLIKAFVIYQERSQIASRHILIVDDGSHRIPDPCKHMVAEQFGGFIFVLRIPDQEVYLVKYIGDQGISLNGLPLRSNRIYNFTSGSVIKIDQSKPVYHSEVVNAFRQLQRDHQISFVAKNIHYQFPNGHAGLRNINIEEESGRLIALMGGSGAGKSTLLNVLNGNEAPSEGSVRINGIDIHLNKKKIEGVIGYVPQDDLLIEELSVFDNLYFAAKLCFRSKTHEELVRLVDKTLESLGLFEIRRLKVGSPLDKTISGGQRKRLNIGLELLREPSVLFVDEPTSGLSSRDSENIMDLLKGLSLKGKMIFVVIHQPSEEIFRMFDKLVILDVGGYQIYYGNPVEAISYFKEAAKVVDHGRSYNPEQIFNIIETKVVNEYGNFTNNRKISPEQWHRMFQQQVQLPQVTETTIPPKKTLEIPGKLKQLSIFSLRDLKAKLANKQYLVINLVEGPLLAFLLAVVVRYTQKGTEYTFGDNLNIPVFFFMSIIVALFMGLTVSAEEIIRDRKILKREAFLNLSRLSYLLSKIIILFGLSAIQTLCYVLVSSFILEIKGMTLSFWTVMFALSCFANILGLNISSAFKSAITVYILIPLLIIPQLILSGVVVSFDKLNPSISSADKVPLIGDIMASRWAFEALAVTQFRDNKYNQNFYYSDKALAETEYKTVYLYPRLESELEYVHHNIKGISDGLSEEISSRLLLLYNALKQEMGQENIPEDKFPEIQEFNPANFSDNTYENSLHFIAKLKALQNQRFKAANQEKQETLKKMTSSEQDRSQFQQLRANYENEAIAVMVKNTAIKNRIVEYDNRLIQKIYPVYNEPEFPAHLLDFSAQFYQPKKHIGGTLIDTFLFNVIFLWLMTFILFVALYFDWLRKILSIFTRE